MRFAVPPVDAPGMTLDDAVALFHARHVAGARLLQRSPPGTPCDPADAAARNAAAAACEALPPALHAAAWEAFREAHRCPSLEQCPLGPRPRGAR